MLWFNMLLCKHRYVYDAYEHAYTPSPTSSNCTCKGTCPIRIPADSVAPFSAHFVPAPLGLRRCAEMAMGTRIPSATSVCLWVHKDARPTCSSQMGLIQSLLAWMFGRLQTSSGMFRPLPVGNHVVIACFCMGFRFRHRPSHAWPRRRCHHPAPIAVRQESIKGLWK